MIPGFRGRKPQPTKKVQRIRQHWLAILLLGLIGVYTLLIFTVGWRTFHNVDVSAWLAGLKSGSPEEEAPTPPMNENAPSGRLVNGVWIPETGGEAGAAPTATPASLEGELVIPALGIAETPMVVPLRSGQWDTTGLGGRVGWLETSGTHPHADRPMVFIGRFLLSAQTGADPLSQPGDIPPGSAITYHSEGRRYTFEVETVSNLAPDAVEMLSEADGESLLLVNCSSAVCLESDQRLVVSARLIAEESE